MADATPMFQTKDNLKAILRLSKLDSGLNNDADEQLDAAIREARTYFWRRLGITRLDQLRALAFVDPPVTDDDHMAQLALLVEFKRVRWFLIPLYVAHYKDGGAAVFAEWNQEAAFRNLNPFQADRLRSALLEEIESDMEILSQAESPGAETTGRFSTIGPPDSVNPPVILGQSLLQGGIFRGIS